MELRCLGNLLNYWRPSENKYEKRWHLCC